jgi:hypothetical protein
MQFLNLRGALAAAAMTFASLVGTPASAAPAHGTIAVTQVPMAPAPVVVATAAAPQSAAPSSGSAWIAQGTVLDPNAQPAAPATPAPAAPVGAIHADSLLQLIGDMPIPVDDTELAPDMKCLAQAVYFESRGEPIEGQLAVAEVVINRAKSDLYPDSYCDVIKQPAQFSFVRHGRIPDADEGSDAWQRAVAIAEIAQQNLWQSKAATAMYFHATYVNPSWAHQKVELAQIDTHIFYR